METRRQIGPDIIRIAAFVLVPAIHFFLNTEYYVTPVKGFRMYFMTILLVICSVCVPLFMLLTGYLMSAKTIAIRKKDLLKFYGKLSGVIITYVLSTVLILSYQCLMNRESLGFRGDLMNLFGYQQYSWYVNMYIGCYLLIPFLNVLWNTLSTKESRRILATVLAVVTILPSVLNVYDLQTPGALFHPWMTGNYAKFVPDWWIDLYPLTFYYLGAYIRCYVEHVTLDRKKLKFALVISVLFFGGYDFWRSYSGDFIWGPWCEWGSLQNTLNSCLVFILLISANYSQCSLNIKEVIGKVAPLTFGAYLVSWIPDHVIYPELIERVPVMQNRILWYFPCVLVTIMTSLFLAQIVQWIQNIILFLLQKILRKSGLHF